MDLFTLKVYYRRTVVLSTMLHFFWRHPTLIAFSIIGFLYSGYCPLNHGGFYCNDDSIAFERAPKEAFDLKPLLFICIVPPMALVCMFVFV